MIRLMVSAAVLVVMAVPAMAATYSDPVKLLKAYYSAYAKSGDDFPDEDVQRAMQSERLNGLFDKDTKEANGEVGRIDSDPFINGQDYQLTKLTFSAPLLAGGKAIVHVTFENFGTAEDLGIALVKEKGGWKIDDVWGGSADDNYDLLDILQAPMPQ